MSGAVGSAGALPVENVLVVGGGIGGLGAAIALGKRGARTTVVEHGDGAVGASIAFNYRPVYALQEIGILDDVVHHGSPMAADEHRSSLLYTATGERLPVSPPVLDDDWSLPSSVRIYRPTLSEIMRRAARDQGAELLFGHSYRSLEPRGETVVAELTTGERHTYDLVVGADGIYSGLRQRFFPEAGQPVYTGSMSFRVMFTDGADDWRAGQHLAEDGSGTVVTSMLADRRFYLAVTAHMERRHVEQAEAREIVRARLAAFRPSKMFDELYERVTDDVHVIVGPFEWIFVEPPWHRGRVVLVGDAVHATCPTIGSAGGMALEDGVVLAQELAVTSNVGEALSAYAARRRERTKLVVEASATLMRTHQERRPIEEEWALRCDALQQLVTPY